MLRKISKKNVVIITVIIVVILITSLVVVIHNIENKPVILNGNNNENININKDEDKKDTDEENSNEDSVEEETENNEDGDNSDSEEETETDSSDNESNLNNDSGNSNNIDTSKPEEPDNNSHDNTSDDNTGNTDNNSGDDNSGSEDIVPTKNPLVIENENLVNEILNTYRISIIYDEKANFYYNGDPGVKTTSADAEEVNYTLKSIRSGLSNIPQSILDTLRLSRGFNVVLFKEVPGGTDGLAVITSHVYQVLLDVDNWQQERIFYHETFHLMERYMYLQNGSKDPFPEWNSYNPVGFTYAYNDGKYLYIDESVPIIERAFVSKYAKTNAGEDRAEIFEDLMHRTRKYYYMEEGYGINEKAKYLDQIIDQYFGIIPGAKWKRWITY